MKRRSYLKPWKLYVLDKYKYVMRKKGGYVGSMSPSQTNLVLKAAGVGNILVEFFEMKPGHGIDNDTIWSVYAVKQKRHHRNGCRGRQTYDQMATACYVCGYEVLGHWYSTLVVKGNKCRDITNYRICCVSCHHASSYHNSLYSYAVTQGHTRRTSLAVRDEIVDLAQAYKVYIHKYSR